MKHVFSRLFGTTLLCALLLGTIGCSMDDKQAEAPKEFSPKPDKPPVTGGVPTPQGNQKQEKGGAATDA